MKTSNHTDEKILNKIYMIRGKKVMVDSDLALLYGVDNKVLKRAVRRNIERFPDDFMLEMSDSELENWRCQIGSANFLRYRPFCFTEQGVTMLACILNSPVAIQMNIRIIRLFSRMREALVNHREILARMELIEKKVGEHDEHLVQLFEAIRLLLGRDEIRIRTKSIGFNKNREE